MKVRLAIVGCGEIASYVAWLARFVPRLQMIACCDSDQQRALRFSQRYRIPLVYQDYCALLEKENFDAVYLAVPHDLHCSMTLQAVEKSKAVLLEKPLARNFDEGKQLIDQIGESKVGVNYQYRYDSALYALARALQKRELGQIYSMCIQVPWHRSHEYFELSPWHRSLQRSGGGTLLTQASHFLDWAFWALDEKPVCAIGFTDKVAFDVEVETIAHAVIQSQGGTLISLTSSMICYKERAVTIQIDAQHGAAFYCDRPFPTVKFQGTWVVKEKPPIRGIHALQRSLSAFCAWVLDETPYLIPAKQALPALAAIDAIYCAAQTGKRESTIYTRNHQCDNLD